MTESAMQRSEEAATASGGSALDEVAVVVHGEVAGDASDYARHRLATLLTHVPEPVLFVRVKLTQAPDPARERPAHAQVTVDINGDLIRAHVAAPSMTEAVDLVRARLQDQLEHRHERQQSRHRQPDASAPGEWRHGDRPTHRPDHYDRPPDERELVQHKTYVVDDLRPDEAAFDLEQLDFDFYLFRDVTTGEESLIERDGAGAYRLTGLHHHVVDRGPSAVDLVVSEQTPPEWTVEQAIDALGADGGRFVFFADAETHRGTVLYLRYDGHYGLIAPE
jgi:ribosome-associated translation inhibitor RaiA